jgi:hypothetical protein
LVGIAVRYLVGVSAFFPSSSFIELAGEPPLPGRK